MRRLLAIAMLLAATGAVAEQMRRLGAWDVHYVLVPTTFLKPAVALSYGIVRAPDQALLNISVLDGTGRAATVAIDGTVTNLLGQQTPLDFAEVREGPAVYYLASIKHTDREVLRFDVNITPPDGTRQSLQFQQQVFLEPQ